MHDKAWVLCCIKLELDDAGTKLNFVDLWLRTSAESHLLLR